MTAKLAGIIISLLTFSFLILPTFSIHAQDLNQLAHQARVNLYEKWNFDSAAVYFQKVIGKEGAPATAYSDYGWFLMLLDRVDEGYTYIEKAAKMAPDDQQMVTWYAWALFWKKDLTKAQQWIKKALALDPNYGEALYVSSLVASAIGNHQEALHQAQKAAVNDPNWRAGVPMALAKAGKEEQAIAEAERIAKDAKAFDAMLLMQTFAYLREDEQALDYLEKAYSLRAPFLPWLKHTPGMEHLHSHPRFKAIVQKMNLPG